jgi:hypothetical protein
MSVKVVNSGSGVINITAETIPTIKVSSPEVTVVDINPVVTGSTVGPTGPTGATGAAGQGVPTGGDQFQVLRKVSGTDYDTEWAFSDRVTIEVRFDEAVSKGDPLYITGYNNGQNRITVAKADAADSAKMPSIGLAKDDYSQNDNGQVTTIGSLDDVNTQVAPNDFQEGDVLYVKAGGGLTNVKPTGTNLIQNVGKVGRRQQNNGEIVVMAIGRSNDVPNIPDGQAWIGNSSGVATPTTLATVATTNSYNDLDDTPTLPDANVDTDLSVSTTTTTVTVISSDGDNATITEATASQAGVMTVDMHDKLDGIAANADVTNGTNVDAAGAIMHSDIATDGFIRRTGAEAYDQISLGTGLSVSADTLNIADTTLAAIDDTNNVILKVTGPSGNQDSGVTLTPSARLTIEPVGDTVTFTVDNDLDNYDNTTSQFINRTEISSTGTAVSGISLTYDNSTGEFDLSGSVSLTQSLTSDLSDVAFESSLQSGGILIYSNSANAYIHNTITSGTGINVTSANGNITIESTTAVDDLNDLTDVNVTGESANQYLVRNSGNTAFENQALDISHDTDPALGGNLDVSGNQIVSSSNGNIVINPDGTGNVKLGNFEFDADQSIGSGVDDFVLTYDDVSRTIRLEASAAGSGTVDTSGTPVADQVAVFTDADTIEGDAGFTYNGTTNVLNVDNVEAKSVRVRSQGSSVLTGAGRFDVGSRVTYDINPFATTTTGDIHVLKGTLWSQADADSVGNAKGLLAVAASTDASKGMVLQGVVRLADNGGFSSATAGTVLYLSDTDGHAMSTTTSLGSGDVVRVVGYVLDGTNGIIYFDPSKDWIELA